MPLLSAVAPLPSSSSWVPNSRGSLSRGGMPINRCFGAVVLYPRMIIRACPTVGALLRTSVSVRFTQSSEFSPSCMAARSGFGLTFDFGIFVS